MRPMVGSTLSQLPKVYRSSRYFTYMSDFLHGDMGFSLRQRGRTVSDIIFSKFPVSARLAGIAVAVAGMVKIFSTTKEPVISEASIGPT